MPLGIERINVRRRSPNALINFITPLEGADKTIAQDYLERIAAIVYPIMKDHGLAVMTLDEFPPNLEFWGRNFNAGECIQLVLKHPNTGQWLPFKFVQGVMIHELAHIKQMNHSSAFWSVRNTYSRTLEALHARSYTGEGFWSTGRTLLSEQYTQDRPLAESDMPMHICGGTYRSRNRRRTAPNGAEKLSYAEQKKRRIERKFGIAGEGKKISADVANISGKVKPRVAQSKRGRELRAAAALKRFEKKEEEESVKAEDDQTASESEDEKKAINVGGGKFMIAVSGEEDGKRESENLNRELMELLGGACGAGTTKLALEGKSAPAKLAWSAAKSKLQLKEVATQPSDTNPDTDCVKMKRPLSPALHTSFTCTQPTAELDASRTNHPEPTTTSRTCPVCSFTNIPHAPTCTACMNVLTLATYAGSSWTCSNVSNCPREYRNSGDVAFCGICGSRRPPQSPSS